MISALAQSHYVPLCSTAFQARYAPLDSLGDSLQIHGSAGAISSTLFRKSHYVP